MYRFYNANPNGRYIDDCVLRTLSLLENKNWVDVYDELSWLSSKEGYLFDNVEFVENYLDSKYSRECHYSKTVGEFADEFKKGKYAVTMNGHITAIIDGIIYDTFDPSNRIMRCAWKMK